MKDGKIQILVVDDEPRYVWAIRLNLESRGYGVLTASDGQTALEIAAVESPDLVILDIRLPGLDGFEVCRRLREFSTIPVIMLTALAEDAEKVAGLDVGADDYVTKPFSAEELLARVRSALRRVEYADAVETMPVVQAGDLLIDLGRQRVFAGDHEVYLTAIEYRLLAELARNAGRVLVPDHLLERVWGPGYEGEVRLVRQVIHRLRNKIEPDPRNPRYVETRHGIGYVFSKAGR